MPASRRQHICRLPIAAYRVSISSGVVVARLRLSARSIPLSIFVGALYDVRSYRLGLFVIEDALEWSHAGVLHRSIEHDLVEEVVAEKARGAQIGHHAAAHRILAVANAAISSSPWMTRLPAVVTIPPSVTCSCYLSDSTHVTIVLMSASGTLLGGIGIVPHTPLPPLFTFCSSFAGAELSPAYFLAISLYPGPTTFLSTA